MAKSRKRLRKEENIHYVNLGSVLQQRHIDYFSDYFEPFEAQNITCFSEYRKSE
jgi:hypothetical protein